MDKKNDIFWRTSLLVIVASVFAFWIYRVDILPKKIITNELSGEYEFNSGGYWFFLLEIRSDKTFYMKVVPDFGGPFEDQGPYVVEDGKIRLMGNPDNIFANKYSFVPVKWGARKYLIEDERISDFCESIVRTSGRQEPRTEVVGLFYLHKDDWKLSVTGEPVYLTGNKVCP